MTRLTQDLISPSTVDCLKRGQKMLFDASISPEDYTTVVDALERNCGKSKFGALATVQYGFLGPGERNTRCQILLLNAFFSQVLFRL